MPKARYAQQKTCEQCYTTYYAARRNSRFCSDACRVKHHRKESKPNFETKYNQLVRSIYDSIYRLEAAAKVANDKSLEKNREVKEKAMLVAMFREKESIAKELRLLLEMNEAPDSWQNFLATKDPITYD
jgi:hypothetical protein